MVTDDLSEEILCSFVSDKLIHFNLEFENLFLNVNSWRKYQQNIVYILSFIPAIWLLYSALYPAELVLVSNSIKFAFSWLAICVFPGYLLLKLLALEHFQYYGKLCLSLLLSFAICLISTILAFIIARDLSNNILIMGLICFSMSVYTFFKGYYSAKLISHKEYNIFDVTTILLLIVIGIIAWFSEQGPLETFEESALHLSIARNYIELTELSPAMMFDYPGRVYPSGIILWEMIISILARSSGIDPVYIAHDLQVMVIVYSFLAIIWLIKEIFEDPKEGVAIVVVLVILSIAGMTYLNQRFEHEYTRFLLGIRAQINHGSVAVHIGIPTISALLLFLLKKSRNNSTKLNREYLVLLLTLITVFFIHPPSAFFEIYLYVVVATLSYLLLSSFGNINIIKKFGTFSGVFLIAGLLILASMILFHSFSKSNLSLDAVSELSHYNLGTKDEVSFKHKITQDIISNVGTLDYWIIPRGLDDKMGLALLLPFVCAMFFLQYRKLRVRLLGGVYIIIVLITYCFKPMIDLIQLCTYSQFLGMPAGRTRIIGSIVAAYGLLCLGRHLQDTNGKMALLKQILIAGAIGMGLNLYLAYEPIYYRPLNLIKSYMPVYAGIIVLILSSFYTHQKKIFRTITKYNIIRTTTNTVILGVWTIYAILLAKKFGPNWFVACVGTGIIIFGMAIIVADNKYYTSKVVNNATNIKGVVLTIFIITIALMQGFNKTKELLTKKTPVVEIQIERSYGLDQELIHYIRTRIPKASIVGVEPVSKYYPSLIKSIYTFPVPEEAVESITMWKIFYERQRNNQIPLYSSTEKNTEYIIEELIKDALKYKIDFYLISPWRVNRELINAVQENPQLAIDEKLNNGMIIIKTNIKQEES